MMDKEEGLYGAAVFLKGLRRGRRSSRPTCPYCGKTMMWGQNGWYCTCPKWNRARREAYREGKLDF